MKRRKKRSNALPAALLLAALGAAAVICFSVRLPERLLAKYDLSHELDRSLYYAAQLEEIDRLLSEASARIDTADDAAQIEEIKLEYRKKLGNVPTASVFLLGERGAAISQTDISNFDCRLYHTDDWAKLNSLCAQYRELISAASSKTALSDAVGEFRAQCAAVPQYDRAAYDEQIKSLTAKCGREYSGKELYILITPDFSLPDLCKHLSEQDGESASVTLRITVSYLRIYEEQRTLQFDITFSCADGAVSSSLPDCAVYSDGTIRCSINSLSKLNNTKLFKKDKITAEFGIYSRESYTSGSVTYYKDGSFDSFSEYKCSYDPA